jgi:hypothetical protein
MNGVNQADVNLQGSVKDTVDGGKAVKLINKTGAASIKGTIVSVSATTAFGVTETPVAATTNIGVIAESGIADGAEVWVTTEGKALVAFHDNIGVMGNYVRAPIAADAAVAVAEVVEFTFTEAVVAVAGNLGIKLPSLPLVNIVLAGGEDHDAVAAKVAAGVFAGWTQAAVNEVVTFTQAVEATTDGIMGIMANATLVTATVAATALGKPAITPTDGIAVASATIPGAGLQVGFLLEDHTARRYADDLALGMCVLKSN